MPDKDWAFIGPGEGKTVWIGDQPFTFKVRNMTQTHGVFELTVPPGSGAPIHVHPSQDETHCITEGEFDFLCEDDRFKASAGSVIFVSRGVSHAFRNTSEKAGKMLVINAPPGPLEDFLEEIGQESMPSPGPLPMDRIMEVAHRTGGIEILAPPDAW